MRGFRTISAPGAFLCLDVIIAAPVTALPSPRTPIVISVSASDGRALLTWIAPPRRGSTVLGYQVADRRRAARAARWGPWRTIDRPSSSRLVAVTVDPRTRHEVRLRARTPAGWGPWTEIHDLVVRRMDRSTDTYQ